MNQIIKHIDIAATDYFVVKQKIGNTYHDLKQFKNNFISRIILSLKKYDSDNDLYIVPITNGTEGAYHKLI